MIISASRRTDIPAYYSDWFFNRIKEQYVLVRNPMNFRQVGKVNLSPGAVDCFVFWTKDPQSFLKRLGELQDYHYYFQFTLNAYGQDIETNVPVKTELIAAFKRLADKIGPEKVIWRYDPILLNDKYTIEYHTDQYGKIANKLKGYTEKCTISFLDFYASISRSLKKLTVRHMSAQEKTQIARNLSRIAFAQGMKMDTCAEDLDLDALGIAHARCIDGGLIAKLTGCPTKAGKDKNQRPFCGCAPSLDIGLYNTCRHGCKYCYANHSEVKVQQNAKLYNPHSPLLCSELRAEDDVYERPVQSVKQRQLNLFPD